MQNLNSFRWSYLISAAILWLCIVVAVDLILAGTPYLAQVLPVVAGGIVWFVVIVPAVLLSMRW